MDETGSKKKSRCYASILYPESAAENWLQVLESLHIKIMISPLHDRDLNKDGSLKKAHYHILMIFPSVKSREQIQEITTSIGSVGQERVLDPVSMALYLTHRNSPNKIQYPSEDVICFNCDYSRFIANERDISDVIGEIIDFIEGENLRSFADLIQYCRVSHPDWLRCIYGRTYFFTVYLRSRHPSYSPQNDIKASAQ